MHQLAINADFRLNDTELAESVCSGLSQLEQDLVHIGMAVYVADRREKRRAAEQSRNIVLKVEVSDPGFWRSTSIYSMLRDAVELISGDIWEFVFRPRHLPRLRGESAFLGFPPDSSTVVCLYSGGLDSAAGLARQLRTRQTPTLAITAYHQPGQSDRVRSQLKRLNERYGRDRSYVSPVIIRTTLRNAPRASEQELTQRCRSFLYASLAGAVTSAVRASQIEVYESGIGALNLPLMAGMLAGGRTTRGCHPAFLRLMGGIASAVAGRPVVYSLPFVSETKAEVVRTLAEDECAEVARQTVSCVHFPRRIPGAAKQCGVCPGCLGRRQALLLAGLDEGEGRYEYDLFGSRDAVLRVPSQQMRYLDATLMQVAELADLEEATIASRLFDRYVYGTGILERGTPAQPWVELLRRYRAEWLEISACARSRDLPWADLVPSFQLVA